MSSKSQEACRAFADMMSDLGQRLAQANAIDTRPPEKIESEKRFLHLCEEAKKITSCATLSEAIIFILIDMADWPAEKQLAARLENIILSACELCGHAEEGEEIWGKMKEIWGNMDWYLPVINGNRYVLARNIAQAMSYLLSFSREYAEDGGE